MRQLGLTGNAVRETGAAEQERLEPPRGYRSSWNRGSTYDTSLGRRRTGHYHNMRSVLSMKTWNLPESVANLTSTEGFLKDSLV